MIRWKNIKYISRTKRLIFPLYILKTHLRCLKLSFVYRSSSATLAKIDMSKKNGLL